MHQNIEIFDSQPLQPELKIVDEEDNFLTEAPNTGIPLSKEDINTPGAYNPQLEEKPETQDKDKDELIAEYERKI